MKRLFFLGSAVGSGDIAWRFFTHDINNVDYFFGTVVAAVSALILAVAALDPERWT